MDYERSCNGCTKCCEGWLPSVIYEKHMYPGVPCHFKKNGGCSIYKDRPKNPCKQYKCEWLKDIQIPEWFKPSESGIILTGREINKIPYLEIVEAGSSMTIEMLNWVFKLHLIKRTNLYYEIKGGWNWIGSPEFCNEIEKKKK
jgi:uncharacterized cysteine cluster protein YcgN (CxxCxxCC family)